VDGEGGLIEIALELEARLLDEFLVFGLAGDRRQLAGSVEGPNPLEIDVEEAVGAGQQAGRFRRAFLRRVTISATAATSRQNDQRNQERRRMRIDFGR